jgi:ABC-type phosphate transport system substrate-binding protein
MSRPMMAEETAAFEAKYGYKVSKFRVAVDALAVYVNKDNPIPCLTLPQLSGIFSSERMAPDSANIKTWGDLGLTGDWAARPIAMYSRNTLSGTYEYFRTAALYGGNYKPNVKLEPGSEAVVQSVASDKFGIGYSGIGYKTDGVRAVPLHPITGRNAMRLPLRRPFPANIRSRATSIFTSTRSRTNLSIRYAPSSSNIFCPRMVKFKLKKAASSRSPMKYARMN